MASFTVTGRVEFQGRRMKALTLHQPVASLMGEPPFKPVENRTWSPPAAMLGQRIAIHAGLKWDDKYVEMARTRYPAGSNECRTIMQRIAYAESRRGMIVSTAMIKGWYYQRPGSGPSLPHERMAVGDIVSRSPWFFGPVGWLLTDFKFLDRSVLCKGMHKLWNVPENILRILEAEGVT